MKKTDFINVVRKIVRDEIKPLISEEISKQMARLLSEVVKNVNSPQQLMEHANNNNKPGTVPTPKKPTKLIKTGNPALDDALNNTSGGIVPEGGSGNVSMMGELARIGESEKLDINEFFKPKPKNIDIDNSSNLNMIRSIVGAGSADEMPSVMDVPDELNPIAGVLKQNFREKMKLIESKAKSVGGGNFLSDMVGQMPGPGANTGHNHNLKSGPINEAIE